MSLYVFQQNEKEFQKKLDEFQKLHSQYGIASKREILKEQMKLALCQAEQQLRFMEIETNASNPQTKQELSAKLRQFKMSYTETQKKLKEIELGLLDSQKSLNSAQTTGDRLVQINRGMGNQLEQLNDLNRKLVQTDDTSTLINENLKRQREQLLKAIDNTGQIKTDLTRTNRQIGMMKNRETYNKGILVSLVCILTIGNILIIYYKFS